MLGDFQSFPDGTYSTRVAKTNPLSAYLHTFIEDHNFVPIDITEGKGPVYTYHHITLENKSYIDHILLSTDLASHVTHCTVHEPSALNTSDHLPLSLHLSIPYQDPIHNSFDQTTNPSEPEVAIPNYMWKNSLFLNLYKSKVQDKINYLNKSTDNDKRIRDIFVLLRQCASEAMSEVNTNHHKVQPKRWWNKELSKSRDKLQRMFNVWRGVGFPRDPDNVSYNRYLFARKLFRTQVKKAKNQSTVHHYINIESIKSSDSRSFWRNIKLSNQKSTRLYTINGKTTVEEITSDFHNHFSNLLNTPRIPSVDNSQSNRELLDLLEELSSDTFVDKDFYITESDVSRAIRKLNTNKSRDPFQLQAEHFLHALESGFLTLITRLLNDLFKDENLPQCLSTSIIIPLLKSPKKSIKDPNNYRGISLIPICTKLIETIILLKFPKITSHGSSQFGFTTSSSTTHAETLILDTIKHYNTKGSAVYICSLDAEKAFDCCSWLKLFQKLNAECILPKTVIRTMIQLYIHGDASVRYRHRKSSPFQLSQGVRQGSVLSPHLYNFYTRDIIDNIKSMQAGTYLPTLDTSIIAFADDLILLSSTLRGLQDMIDKCVECGKDHLIKFNDKTQFTVAGKATIPDPTITVNDVIIRPKDKLVHLGFKWNLTNAGELTLKYHKDDRINKLWATTSSLISSGIRKLHPRSIATIYQTIVIPQLLYGLEIVKMSKTELDHLDRQGRACLKSLLGLSKFSKNYLLNVFNLREVSALIANRRVQLLDQLIRNDLTRSYVLQLLTYHDVDHLVLDQLRTTCSELNIDMLNVCISGIDKSQLKGVQIPKLSDTADIQSCRDFLDNWHVFDNRESFRDLTQIEVRKS